MGKNQHPTNLTREQRTIFSAVLGEEYIKKNFYFTGGTALSSFYFQHRHSEDLDFFSEKQFDREQIESIVGKWSDKYGFTFENKEREVVRMYMLNFGNTTLKLDFATYPYPKLVKGIDYQGLSIDSLRDIATNKLLCVQSRTDVKDFVDLYYLLSHWNVWEISYGLEKKFRREFDPVMFAEDFMKMQDFTTLPRMIKPLSIDELKSFYFDLARELVKDKVI